MPSILYFRSTLVVGSLLGLILTNPSFAQKADSDATVEAARRNPDFAVQGEYEGPGLGLQVIARGDGEFELVLFNGGLPGAGWDKSLPTRVEGDSETVGQVALSKHLKRIERRSPTLGAKAPSDATVLFDGTQSSLTKHWKEDAKITEHGLLKHGATTKGNFRDYTLHLEFRTPFEPTKEGQGRGNSGVYHQGRFETQVLDSLGLEGKNNEAGGLYGIRDPDLNMCFPPLSWQTYDIEFTAARLDGSGKKFADAQITVKLNGVVVHQDVPLPETVSLPSTQSATDGPIHLQDHGNEVSYRNIWLAPRDAEREARRPIIPGYERFLVGDAIGGRVLISQLSCVACHSSTEPTVAPKSAPILDLVGTRVRFDHLVAVAGNARGTKIGTTMPDLFHGLSDEQRTSNGKAIASFLSQTGKSIERSGDSASSKRGQDLFHSIGCVACHAPRAGDSNLTSTSVPLGDLAHKYTLDGLSQFLQNPHQVRPSGLMPTMITSSTEARDIACYLLGDSILVPSSEQWAAKIYYGQWDKLPDFSQLKPAKSLTTTGLDLSASERTSDFAMQFEAYLPVTVAGDYRFFLSSDDGSRLRIDGDVLIDHDGIHPSSFKTSKKTLQAGVHRIQVDYFEKGGEEELALEIEGPNSGRSPIDSWITSDPKGNLDKELIPSRFQADLKLVAAGQSIYVQSGCANCHALKLNDQSVSSTLVAKPLAKLDATQGCLSETVRPGLPEYELTRNQRDAIVAALKSLEAPLETEARVHLQLANANCYSCHTRGTVGGPESARNAFFKSTVQEMGSEGRLPPSLTGVGDKLQSEVIDSIIANGGKVRPYVLTRMPGFGNNKLGGLREHLVTLDIQSRGPSSVPAMDSEAGTAHRVAGRKLVGGEGLACIKCHRFGDKATPGIAAIDMLTMPKRLREDWFHRYMLAPTEYRPGTRMPLSFPDGKSTLVSVYDGDAHKQIDAMWLYLSQGKDAKLPSGLNPEAIVLSPNDKPIVYRNFIEGLSPRGIAIGYPEKVNVAWDAGNMNLRLLWKNEFIDASKHWVGRGPGFQGPQGDDITVFEKSAPIAHLSEPMATWPTEPARKNEYHFKGYTLNTAGQPTFKYLLGTTEVQDFLIPKLANDGTATIERQLKIKNRDNRTGMYFRAAAGRIEKGAGDSYILDGKVTLTIRGVPVALININNSQELRCKFPDSGESVVTQIIQW